MSEIYSNDPLASVMLEQGARPPAELSSAPYCPQALAYFSAMTVKEPLGVKMAVNSFILALINAGVFALLDWLIIPMATEQSTLLNIINPAVTFVNTNGAVFTPYRGYKGDGSTSYLQGGAKVPNYAQNSASMSVYINQQNVNVATAAQIGALNVGNTTVPGILSNTGTTIFISRMNDTGPTLVYPDTGTRLGFVSSSRTSSVLTTGYRNGVSVVTSATASSGGADLGGNITVLRRDTMYSTDQIAMAACGGGLSAPQELAFYNATLSLLTLLGAN